MTPEIRPLTFPEIETLVGWAGAEGWNPGIGDAEAFQAADPGGFLGAFVNGEMAAGIAAVAYDDALGFVGLYICRPEHRGRGLGRAVWDAGLARLGARTVGLDGVPAQQAAYRSMGFKPAYSTLRYLGRPQPASRRPTGEGVSILPYDHAMRDAVAALDAMCFPAPRGGFLEAWLRKPRLTLAAVRDGKIVGFGALRPCVTGCKIGPLFAQDFNAAEALFPALASHAEGDLSVDVPEERQDFRNMLGRAGMLPGFTTARMYLGRPPRFRSDWVFGVTTLELG